MGQKTWYIGEGGGGILVQIHKGKLKEEEWNRHFKKEIKTPVLGLSEAQPQALG